MQHIQYISCPPAIKTGKARKYRISYPLVTGGLKTSLSTTVDNVNYYIKNISINQYLFLHLCKISKGAKFLLDFNLLPGHNIGIVLTEMYFIVSWFISVSGEAAQLFNNDRTFSSPQKIIF